MRIVVLHVGNKQLFALRRHRQTNSGPRKVGSTPQNIIMRNNTATELVVKKKKKNTPYSTSIAIHKQNKKTHLSTSTAGGARRLRLEGTERGSGSLDDHSRPTALPARVRLGSRLHAAAITGVAAFQVADTNLRTRGKKKTNVTKMKPRKRWTTVHGTVLQNVSIERGYA